MIEGFKLPNRLELYVPTTIGKEIDHLRFAVCRDHWAVKLASTFGGTTIHDIVGTDDRGVRESGWIVSAYYTDDAEPSAVAIASAFADELITGHDQTTALTVRNGVATLWANS